MATCWTTATCSSATKGPNPPGADHIRELDWESRLVWEYYNPSMRRHNRLPNGNNLFLLQRDRISAELTRQGPGRVSPPPQRPGADVQRPGCGGSSRRYGGKHLAVRGPSEPRNRRNLSLGESRDAWGGANDLTSSPDGSTFLISFRILDTVALVGPVYGGVHLEVGPRATSPINTIPPTWTTATCSLLDNGSHRRGLSHSQSRRSRPGHQRNSVAVPRPAYGFLFHPFHRRRPASPQRQHPHNRGSCGPAVRGNPRK